MVIEGMVICHCLGSCLVCQKRFFFSDHRPSIFKQESKNLHPWKPKTK